MVKKISPCSGNLHVIFVNILMMIYVLPYLSFVCLTLPFATTTPPHPQSKQETRQITSSAEKQHHRHFGRLKLFAGTQKFNVLEERILFRRLLADLMGFDLIQLGQWSPNLNTKQ